MRRPIPSPEDNWNVLHRFETFMNMTVALATGLGPSTVNDILPRQSAGLATSDVTYSCIRPLIMSRVRALLLFAVLSTVTPLEQDHADSRGGEYDALHREAHLLR